MGLFECIRRLWEAFSSSPQAVAFSVDVVPGMDRDGFEKAVKGAVPENRSGLLVTNLEEFAMHAYDTIVRLCEGTRNLERDVGLASLFP